MLVYEIVGQDIEIIFLVILNASSLSVNQTFF